MALQNTQRSSKANALSRPFSNAPNGIADRYCGWTLPWRASKNSQRILRMGATYVSNRRHDEVSTHEARSIGPLSRHLSRPRQEILRLCVKAHIEHRRTRSSCCAAARYSERRRARSPPLGSPRATAFFFSSLFSSNSRSLAFRDVRATPTRAQRLLRKYVAPL